MDRFNRGFFSDLAERTIATFAQAFLAAVPVSAVAEGGIMEVDFVMVLSIAALAALLAVVKGFAGDITNPETGASWGTAVPAAALPVETHNSTGSEYLADPASQDVEGFDHEPR